MAAVERVDSHMIEAIRESGQLDAGEYVTEAVVVYAAIRADRPGQHSYGFVPLHGFIAHHSMLGLLEHQAAQLKAASGNAE